MDRTRENERSFHLNINRHWVCSHHAYKIPLVTDEISHISQISFSHGQVVICINLAVFCVICMSTTCIRLVPYKERHHASSLYCLDEKIINHENKNQTGEFKEIIFKIFQLGAVEVPGIWNIYFQPTSTVNACLYKCCRFSGIQSVRQQSYCWIYWLLITCTVMKILKISDFSDKLLVSSLFNINIPAHIMDS